MKTLFILMLMLAVAAGTISCATPARQPASLSPEDRLRHKIGQEPGQEIVAIQYESDGGTAVVQLRHRDAAGKARLSYRWYVREGDAWTLAPYVGVKRPDAP